MDIAIHVWEEAMNKDDAVQVVSWCKECGTTFVTTHLPESCGFCQGPVKELGWVEESNG
jgi:rubrerythrin